MSDEVLDRSQKEGRGLQTTEAEEERTAGKNLELSRLEPGASEPR